MTRFSTFGWVCEILLIIGGLNWGIIGFWNYNVIDAIFHNVPSIARLIYILVGLATLWVVGEAIVRVSGTGAGKPRPA